MPFLLLIVNFFIAFIFILKKHDLTFIPFLIIFTLLGYLSGIFALSPSPNNIINYENKTATIEGTICEEPIIKQDEQKFIILPISLMFKQYFGKNRHKILRAKFISIKNKMI